MANSFPYCTLDDVKSVLLGLDVSDIPTTLEAKITGTYIKWAQRDVDKWAGTNFDATLTQEFYDGTGSQYMFVRHRPIREVLNIILYIIPSVQWFQFSRWFYVQQVDQLGLTISRRGGVAPKDDGSGGTFIPDFDLPGFIFDVAFNPGFQNTDTLASGNVTADFNNTFDQYGQTDLFVDTKLGKLTIPPRILFLESQAVPFWNYTFLRGEQNIQIDYIYGYSDPTQDDLLLDPGGGTKGNLPLEITQACANLTAKYILMDKGLFMGSGAKAVSIDGVNKQYGEVPYAGQIKYLENQARELLKPYKRLGV